MRAMRVAGLFLIGGLTGCFASTLCEEETCPAPADDPCEGTCVPFVGGGWQPVLVAMAEGTTRRERCPAAAPFETMSSASPPLTACGAPQAAGECSAPGFTCLSTAPAWSTCMVRDGAHECPDPYPTTVAVDTSITLCCPGEETPL